MGKGARSATNPESLVLSADAKELLSGPSYAAKKLAPEDAWIEQMDLAAFGKECNEIGKELAEQQGVEDTKHLAKIIMWSRMCQYLGLGLAYLSSLTSVLGVFTYVMSAAAVFLLSLGTLTRWTIVGHHVCHGGFDKCSKGQYSRFKFGVGTLWRRCVDWLDWMLVEAWNVEHNQLHHYHLGEIADPDLVEHNMAYLRELEAPKFVKYLVVAYVACTWKWWYYSPNTFKQLSVSRRRKRGLTELPGSHKPQVFDFAWLIGMGDNTFFSGTEFLTKCLAPFFFQRFILLPLPFAFIGGFRTVFLTLFAAELLTNAHAFLVIATNHAGNDLYRFEHHCKPRTPTFYLRQVISSANFATGNDILDFSQGWLNYQVEHHLWPDLSMKSYQTVQPRVKALCKKYGIPYVQHNVFYRLLKLVDVMIGNADMRKYPSAFERQEDLVFNDSASNDKLD